MSKEFVNMKIKIFNGQAATMGLFLTSKEKDDGKAHRKLEPTEVVRVPKEDYERRIRQPNCLIEQTLDAPTRPITFPDSATARWSSPSERTRGAQADAARAAAKVRIQSILTKQIQDESFAKAEPAKAEKSEKPQRRSS